MIINNEQLVILAQQGNDKAKIQLYNELKTVWEKRNPFDATYTYDREDWLSYCKQLFFEAINEFDVNKKVPFRAFLISKIKYRIWNRREKFYHRDQLFTEVENEITSDKQKINIAESTESTPYIDYDYYIDNFKKQLNDRKLKVFITKLEDESTTYHSRKRLIKKTQLSTRQYEHCLNTVKKQFKTYIREEFNKKGIQ